jgi:hypothetical protein
VSAVKKEEGEISKKITTARMQRKAVRTAIRLPREYPAAIMGR